MYSKALEGFSYTFFSLREHICHTTKAAPQLQSTGHLQEHRAKKSEPRSRTKVNCPATCPDPRIVRRAISILPVGLTCFRTGYCSQPALICGYVRGSHWIGHDELSTNARLIPRSNANTAQRGPSDRRLGATNHLSTIRRFYQYHSTPLSQITQLPDSGQYESYR